MKKIKALFLMIFVFALNIGTYAWFKDLLHNNYSELGSNNDADAVYFDAEGGFRYATREHTILFFIPYGREQYYAFIDNSDEEHPILYTAIVTDDNIMKKLENQENVRLQGLKKHLNTKLHSYYNRIFNKLNDESIAELKYIGHSFIVIDTTYDKTKAIIYLLAVFGALIYSIWLFIQSFQNDNITIRRY